MDLRLTPDLIEIRERSRRFCDEWLIPFELETEEAGSLSMESYARIRQAVLDANLNAMNMPVEWGGQGFSILQQVLALEQLGRVDECALGLRLASGSGARALHSRRSARASSSPSAAASGAMPTRSPSRTRAPTSRASRRSARRVDGGWRISGEKWFVTDADIADYLIVVAEAEGHGQTCFLVDSAADGVRETRRPRYMHTFVVRAPGVRVRGLLRARRPGARRARRRATSSPRTGSSTSA